VVGKQLAAYFVKRAGSSLTSMEVRGFLKRQLPSYMVPDYCIDIAAFPLNDNGKVERHKLPKPSLEHQTSVAVVPPGTALEQRVWQIWCDLLQGDQFGVEDEFFSLGGHSLLAAQVVAVMHEQLGVKIPLKNFFAEPTVRGLCRYIELADWASVNVAGDAIDEEVGYL
jgi:acyl carrier protein